MIKKKKDHGRCFVISNIFIYIFLFKLKIYKIFTLNIIKFLYLINILLYLEVYCI